MPAPRSAVQLMIAQAILFAAETAAIHHIGPGASIIQIALVRAAAGAALAGGLARRTGKRVWRTPQLRLQLLRGAITLLYMWVMIISFSYLPFAASTGISYTQSAYIAAFSALILGEVVTRVRWTAAAIGIVGALLIAKPGFATWNAVYFIALFAAALNGLAFVLNRYLQRADSEATTLFYSNLVPLLGNIPVLLMTTPPTPATLVWFPAIMVCGPLGMLAGIAAVRHVSASALGPLTLLRLVIAVAGGIVVFHEIPDIFSVAGVALILFSCLLSTNTLTPGQWRLLARPKAGRYPITAQKRTT